MTQKAHPILYSFRRCPYAMRARLGLKAAGVKVELREVVLRNKPEHMIELSPKATVPVLWLGSQDIVDESLDIALWALKQNDPLKLLTPEQATIEQMNNLIAQNDGPFKHHLDRTKYANRYPDENPLEHRIEASKMLLDLDSLLQQHKFLCGNRQSLADITIAPFVRQFANSDRNWFETQPWPHLNNWLTAFIESAFFQEIMEKYPPWQDGDQPTYFP